MPWSLDMRGMNLVSIDFCSINFKVSKENFRPKKPPISLVVRTVAEY